MAGLAEQATGIVASQIIASYWLPLLISDFAGRYSDIGLAVPYG